MTSDTRVDDAQKEVGVQQENGVKGAWQYRRNCEIRDPAAWPEGMQRIALVVEYMGADYQGFQRQASAKVTVQGELEKALSAIACEPITLGCAGRTDAGVHATQQVVHFDTLAVRPLKAWRQGVNTKLPDTIRVVEAVEAPPAFHSRFSAKARTYRYVLQGSKIPSALMINNISWTKFSLNMEAMQQGADFLIGEHDFSSFRARHCQAVTPERNIKHIRLTRCGDYIVMEIKATAFLYNMVRNIVGVLIEVGRGAKQPEWVGQVLAEKSRCAAATTAPPQGLYFVGVDYPGFPEIPSQPKGPGFVAGYF